MRPRPERVDEPLRVLFVCTANISRSPYAERMAAHLAGRGAASGVCFASAGVPGFPGRGMDREMAAQLRGRGVEPNGHVSRSVSSADLAEADVVITAELTHRWRIAEGWPEHATKVFGLRQLADALDRSTPSTGGLEALDGALAVARPDSLSWDIADPYRRGTAAARGCAVEIEAALSVIVPALTGPPVPR